MAPYTPSRSRIMEKAVEIWNKWVHVEPPEVWDIIPEEEELKERTVPGGPWAGLTYWEAARRQLMTKPENIAREMLLAEYESKLAEHGLRVLKEERLEELLDLEKEVERLQKRIKQLESVREAEREEAERQLKKVREELEKTKPIKVELLEDIPPWHRKGAVIETRDFPWVLELVEKGKARVVPPEV